MKHMNTWFVVAAIVSTCAIGLAVSPMDSTNNYPAVFPNTAKPTPVADAGRTNNNAALPPMDRGTIANLHDTVGTNAVNHANDGPTLTNQPNPSQEMPHVPPQ